MDALDAFVLRRDIELVVHSRQFLLVLLHLNLSSLLERHGLKRAFLDPERLQMGTARLVLIPARVLCLHAQERDLISAEFVWLVPFLSSPVRVL